VTFALIRFHFLHIPVVAASFSLYIGFGLFCALYLPGAVHRAWWTTVILIFELVMLGIGLTSGVRSVWVAVPGALVVTYLLTRHSGSYVWRRVARIGVALAATSVVAALVYPSTIDAVGREASSIASYNQGVSSSDANAQWRLNNWQYGFSQIRRHEWTGIGFGQAEVPPDVCAKGCAHQTGDSTIVPGSDLHNSILAIALRLGVPLFLVFVAFEACVFAQARRRGRRDPFVRWALACHLLTGFTALTAVVLEGPYMGIFFWFFAGLVLGQTSDQDDEAPSGVPA
jgi:O-antigen ligase